MIKNKVRRLWTRLANKTRGGVDMRPLINQTGMNEPTLSI